MRPRSLLFFAKCLLSRANSEDMGRPANLVVSIIISVPEDKLADAIRKGGAGRKPRHPRQPLDVGECGWDVARLHRQVPPLEPTSRRRLDRRNELGELNWRVIANI